MLVRPDGTPLDGDANPFKQATWAAVEPLTDESSASFIAQCHMLIQAHREKGVPLENIGMQMAAPLLLPLGKILEIFLAMKAADPVAYQRAYAMTMAPPLPVLSGAMRGAALGLSPRAEPVAEADTTRNDE